MTARSDEQYNQTMLERFGEKNLKMNDINNYKK